MLDTHAFLWWLADNPALPAKVRTLIADPNSAVYVSAASGWEIAIKKSLGKLRAPANLGAVVEAEGFEHLPIRFEHGERAGSLPAIHSDPFDRMLVAQGQLEGLAVVTADRNIPRYKVKTIWG